MDFPDGLTIGIGRLEPVTHGWVVKVKNAQNFEGENGMKKAFAIARETSQTIAGWKDGETELWDVVEIFDNEGEATEFGKAMEQMTIYNIETGQLKWLD